MFLLDSKGIIIEKFATIGVSRRNGKYSTLSTISIKIIF
jgi:hypothetical protein